MLRRFISCVLLAGSVASFPAWPTTPLDRRRVRTIADIKEYPYQLSLWRDLRHICGTVLISNKWTVTAAHCVHYSWPANYSVYAGSNDKYAGGVSYPLKRYIRHPAYNYVTIDYDIALLEIDGKITFNDRVQPVRLPEKELASGVMVSVTGWGPKKQGGKQSPVLTKATISIMNRKTCQDIYRKVHRRITDRMICAGNIRDQYDGQDACEGDSGGPLTVNNTLYGIVSWGYKCSDPSYPGVYTNVVNLLWWIKWILISGV